MIDETPQLAASGINSLEWWKTQITSAQANISSIANTRGWDQNTRSYLGQGDRQKWGKNTTLVRKDYSLTEIKKALIFYQLPDVAANAKKPEFAAAAPLVGAVVNQYLSPAYTNAMAMIDEVLSDMICPAGIGVSKIGYEAFINPEQREIPAINPTTGLPALDDRTGQVILQPNIVRETTFWNRIPPKMFLYPASFIGSDFDKSPWVGFKFTLPKPVAERVFELSTEQLESGGSPDLTKDLLASDVSRAEAQSEQTETVTLYEIWYRASAMDPMVGDPEIIRQLVILEDQEGEPLIHRDSPYQDIQDGKMVAGMHGYPVHVFSLRYVSDQAIPPSDCSVSRDQVDELSRGRTQMIDQRDRAVPLTAVDGSRTPKEVQDKILKGETQELIIFESFDAANPPIVGIRKADWPRENFAFNDIVTRDIEESWSISANQQGVTSETKRTATELSLTQSGTDTSMDKQRARFLRQFAIGCQKLLALIQMFATEQDFAQVADESGQMVLQAWDATAVAGDYEITLAPDSSQRIDAAVEKKRAIDMYTIFGNDPLIDPVELRKAVFRKLGMDANKLVKAPQPKPPEKPQVSVSLKGEDISPQMPQYPNVMAILAAGGIGVQMPTGEQPPPDMAGNPGSVAPVTPIDKRVDNSQATGQLPGGGQAADAGMVAGA